MRQPKKMLEIYQKLKSAIESGEYQSGAFLPREVVLAQNFGISRDTLRSVLTKLAEEKIIERLYPKGTMICNRQSKARPPLTFLLPCADFISETYSSVAAQSSRRILKGVSQIAFEYDYRVETVPVSPTNNQHEIDWRKLDFVNADSLLVVTSEWYRELFPLLLERGCRVAFIHGQISHMKEDKTFIDSCFRIKINYSDATEAATEYMVKQGCRRIALFHRCILEPGHPVMNGYLAGLKKCGLKFAAWHELPDEPLKLEDVKIILKDFYRKSGGFDSMIITPELATELCFRNLYQELELDENIKIIVSSDVSNNQLVTPSLTSMAFPYEEIGRIVARHLVDSEFLSGEQLINGRLIERESTLNYKNNFALV
jgi:DNA-binding LacI/PurR family transcriptional regulator